MATNLAMPETPVLEPFDMDRIPEEGTSFSEALIIPGLHTQFGLVRVGDIINRNSRRAASLEAAYRERIDLISANYARAGRVGTNVHQRLCQVMTVEAANSERPSELLQQVSNEMQATTTRMVAELNQMRENAVAATNLDKALKDLLEETSMLRLAMRPVHHIHSRYRAEWRQNAEMRAAILVCLRAANAAWRNIRAARMRVRMAEEEFRAHEGYQFPFEEFTEYEN